MAEDAEKAKLNLDKETERLLHQYKTQYKNKPASWYFFPLAQIYCQIGEFEEAAGICLKGLENCPNLWAARVVLAQAYLGLKNVKEARIQLEMVLQELPNNLLAGKLLARIYLEQDRIGAALSRYRAAGNFYPECTDLEESIRHIRENELRQAQKMLEILGKWQVAAYECQFFSR